MGQACFVIKVVDEETGRGVPLVELRTVNEVSYWTDSGGVAAFDEPGLMDKRVFFFVSSHGYEFPKDGFGYRGTALDVSPGGSATLKIKRLNIAERLYRMTGEGLYRDTVLAGLQPPIKQPLVNALVLGQDSVQNALYHGRLYWFWGDTNRPGYPLGNFHMPGATSRLPADGGLDPAVGVDLEYFVDQNGFAKETCRMPGDGPTWATGFTVLREPDGRERMFAAYAKIKAPMDTYQRGIVEWNDETQQFDKRFEFPIDAPAAPYGHPFIEGEYVHFGDPYPVTRTVADPQHFLHLTSYECFTCVDENGEVERGADGKVGWSWKQGVKALSQEDEAKLLKDGKLKAEEARFQLRDAQTGKPVLAHRGSVCWNEYRKRWIMIATQQFGTSMLGEVWYAEADSPTGPWTAARKIVTHDKYSFYNPKQHPYFDEEGGRVIYFEGTYTKTFSGNEQGTPRYDYNQIMYRLDLAKLRSE
ncbi:MAG: DUF4185 domain-containing protein [Armatimonadetes bacterium]|nr:DUF4185 domain-containing protein [Armatimonadota bacterium]